MEPVSLTVISISFIITILIVVLGIQVFFILKEIRIGLQKGNKMLDDAGKVTDVVSSGVTSVGGFMQGIKTGISVFTSLKRGDSHE